MTGAFSRKSSGIACALTVLRKIKEHRANAVETPLGVTGLLGTAKSARTHRRKSLLLFVNDIEPVLRRNIQCLTLVKSMLL